MKLTNVGWVKFATFTKEWGVIAANSGLKK